MQKARVHSSFFCVIVTSPKDIDNVHKGLLSFRRILLYFFLFLMQFPVLLRSERTNMRVTPIPARQRFLSFFFTFWKQTTVLDCSEWNLWSKSTKIYTFFPLKKLPSNWKKGSDYFPVFHTI